MKMKTLRRKPASIAKTRWAAYATAGAATALAGSHSLEAAIHYSGPVHVNFPPNKSKTVTFPLDQAGDFFQFEHFGSAGFDITGIVSANVRGFRSWSRYNSDYVFAVSKLSRGQNISSGYFGRGRFGDILLSVALHSNRYYYYGAWDPGIGFVGFTFNNGAGVQYGWVRVRMSNLPLPQIAFTVLDYAYADPGEPITAGQRSSAELAPDQGSLGWLATGAVGLLAWRKSRSQTAS